jgi:hypothetical protein
MQTVKYSIFICFAIDSPNLTDVDSASLLYSQQCLESVSSVGTAVSSILHYTASKFQLQVLSQLVHHPRYVRVTKHVGNRLQNVATFVAAF